MSAEEPVDRDALEEQAAEWLMRRDAGFTAAEQAEFERWRAADPRHAAELTRLESAWRFVTRPARRGQGGEVLGRLAQLSGRRRRRRAVGVLAAAAALALAAGLGWRRPVADRPELTAPVAAVLPSGAVPRPERQVLEDGSVIEVRAGARVEVEFSTQERRVRLFSGVAHFAVAKDPRRPFTVVAAGTTARAIGTEFLVDRGAGIVAVLVTEGVVQVGAAEETPAATPVRLAAGQRATVASATAGVPHVERLSPAAVAAALAWRSQRLEFTDLPLADVVAIFNRVNDAQLVLGDQELGRQRVSGTYWTDNPAGFAELMAAGFDLQVERPAAGRIVLRR